ncbi:hypothetical protein GA0115260_108481, partial [Streptomyces sp. MnatMP-M27]
MNFDNGPSARPGRPTGSTLRSMRATGAKDVVSVLFIED